VREVTGPHSVVGSALLLVPGAVVGIQKDIQIHHSDDFGGRGLVAASVL